MEAGKSLLSTGLRPVLEYAAPLELFIMVFKAQRAETFQHRSQACARQVRILLKEISLDMEVLSPTRKLN